LEYFVQTKETVGPSGGLRGAWIVGALRKPQGPASDDGVRPTFRLHKAGDLCHGDFAFEMK